MAMAYLDDLVKEHLIEPINWPFEVNDFFSLSTNPFTDKLPDSRAFIGYENEVMDLLRCIRTKTNVFITGPIGTGKTAMCKSVNDAIVRSGKNYRSFFIRIEHARFEKELAKEMLKSIGGEYKEYSSVAELYKSVLSTCKELNSRGVTVVGFIDDIVHAGKGALRQVLYLIPDVLDYQPVLIFNGTGTTIKAIKRAVPSLIDRIGEYIYLEGLKKSDDVRRLVNVRIRLGCKVSIWNGGAGCKKMQEGQITCDECLGPFSGEVVSTSIEKVGNSPRNLINFFKIVIEKAAEEKKLSIEEKFADESSQVHFKKQVGELDDDEKKVVEYLFKMEEESSGANLNSIAAELNMTHYTSVKIIEDLMAKHLVILKLSGELTLYRLTPQVRKAIYSAGGF